MSLVIYPSESWEFSYKDYVGKGPYKEGNETIMSLIEDEGSRELRLISSELPKNFKLKLYFSDPLGTSIAIENKIMLSFKATSTPTDFKKFELFLEDYNGKIATYSFGDDDLGKTTRINTKALVKEEGFNESYVVKIGFNIDSCKVDRERFMMVIGDFEFSSAQNPSYCDPQEVIEFLGMVDNRGQPFKLTESSTPTYSAIAKRIVEAEAYVEAQCRRAWIERRVVGEIRNASYFGITATRYARLAMDTHSESGLNMLFRGIPVKLTNSYILPIDSTKGDKVEVRRYGAHWVDVSDKAVWEDPLKGIIFIQQFFVQDDTSVRVTYRHGHGPVPDDIRRAVLLKCAMQIIQTDWFRQHFPQAWEEGFSPNKGDVYRAWSWELKNILSAYSSHFAIGGM